MSLGQAHRRATKRTTGTKPVALAVTAEKDFALGTRQQRGEQSAVLSPWRRRAIGARRRGREISEVGRWRQRLTAHLPALRHLSALAQDGIDHAHPSVAVDFDLNFGARLELADHLAEMLR